MFVGNSMGQQLKNQQHEVNIVDKHIIYYYVNKKMEAKALKGKTTKKIDKYSRLGHQSGLTKPLNINITLSTPKFHLRVIIRSMPISSNQFLVSSSCLLVTK